MTPPANGSAGGFPGATCHADSHVYDQPRHHLWKSRTIQIGLAAQIRVDRASGTSGPTQHTDAPMAASTPAIGEPFTEMGTMPVLVNLLSHLRL